MTALDQALLAYGKSQAYPFHMPGHKRRFPQSFDPNLMDITEIDGFDDLHDAGGMIADIERELAELYGVAQARLLVGGATLGNLVSLLSHLEPQDTLLMARNCHKSIYHGAILGRLSVEYIYPQALTNGLQGPVRAASVQEALCAAEKRGQKIKLVAITSPTYEGVVSDLSAIAQIAHTHGALLLVDAAHGAHFGLHPYFPPSMADQGADLLVISLHKTLPFYTMTAALLLPDGSWADRERVANLIDYLETSSPSYILMGQAAAALRFLRQEGEARFRENARDLKQFYKACEDLRALRILRTDDPGKIVISCARTSLTGQRLMEWLREEYQLELEMASFDYVLAMTSLMDTSEGLRRLQDALFEIDALLAGEADRRHVLREERQGEQKAICGVDRVIDHTLVYGPRRKILEPWQALRKKWEEMDLEECAGCISRDSILLYPPGIPLVHSGEEITEEVVRYLKMALADGLKVQGLRDGKTRVLV